MIRCALVVTLLVVFGGACGNDGGDDAGVSKADLVTALRAGTDQATAECVADGLLEAGLTQAELLEFATFTGDDEPPSQIDVYTRVRQRC